ncbi:MAG: M57 family metalloprotease [Bacteriovoracaceae bacterium]|jgi:hypothetical protein|nr:M57 family metalloprotease [Bacteriovoracaceae bacterium]
MKYYFLAILLFFPFYHAYAWTLNPNTQKGFKNNEIKIFIANTTCSGAGFSTSRYVDLIKNAVEDYWNKVPTSALFLKVEGIKDDIDITGDTHSSALNKVPANTIVAGCNASATDFDDSSILGSAAMQCSGNTCRAILILNAHSSSKLPQKSDREIEAVIAHEIGHAFGLGHSEYQQSLMYYNTSGKYQKWLGDDDIDGVTYLYPHESKFDLLGQSLLGNCGAIAATDNLQQQSFFDYYSSLALGVVFVFFIYFIRRKLKG